MTQATRILPDVNVKQANFILLANRYLPDLEGSGVGHDQAHFRLCFPQALYDMLRLKK